MAQPLEVLELTPELTQTLQTGGIETVQQLRDSTYEQLSACGLDESASRELFATLSQWLERRFRAEVLLPELPDPCQYVECAYLVLPDDVLVSLEVHGFQYLYEVALSRRAQLNNKLGPESLPVLNEALSDFLESYRQGEIELQIEEN